MRPVKSIEDRTFPRQIKMTDAFHGAAVAAAAAERKSFSEYVRDLIAKDLRQRGKADR